MVLGIVYAEEVIYLVLIGYTNNWFSQYLLQILTKLNH